MLFEWVLGRERALETVDSPWCPDTMTAVFVPHVVAGPIQMFGGRGNYSFPGFSAIGHSQVLHALSQLKPPARWEHRLFFLSASRADLERKVWLLRQYFSHSHYHSFAV